MSSSRKQSGDHSQRAATTATTPITEPVDDLGQLEPLPDEMLVHIARKGSDTSIASTTVMSKLASCNKNFNGLFQPMLNQQYAAAKQLLKHVLLGKKDQAEAMIKANPTLLRIVATAKDHAGRTIKATPLRAALGAKDVSIGKHEEMAEMIMRHMKESLSNGEAEIERQKAVQFPEGWEQKEAARKAADTAALYRVFTAIDASRTDDQRKAAVAVFQAHLARQNDRVIETGYHFNEQLFEKAGTYYDRYYTQFRGYKKPKNRTAAINVIGGIQSRFTACLAQAACDGFGKVVNKKAPLSRSLTLSYPDNFPFFHVGLGRSYFVYCIPGPAWACPWGGFLTVRRAVFPGRPHFSKLMSSKNSKLGKIIQPARNHRTSSRCVVQ